LLATIRRRVRVLRGQSVSYASREEEALAGGKDTSRHNEACQVTTFRPADVKSVCEKFKASQTDFPLMLGVSVATLHS